LSGRQRLPGHSGYSHLEANSEAAAVFNLAMVQLTRLVAVAVATACDFSKAQRFVDVGGGYGELLVACMLRARSDATGILLEMGHAVAGARTHLHDAGLAGRAAAQEGDFFVGIPAGADVYLLKAVLHNWDDARCDAILANVKRAMAPDARLVVVERVLPERMAPTAAHRAVARSDLNMLVGLGGRERTQGELTARLRAAGFAQPCFKPAAAGFYAIEASGC
jgi:SAM-dependent methyltransferase